MFPKTVSLIRCQANLEMSALLKKESFLRPRPLEILVYKLSVRILEYICEYHEFQFPTKIYERSYPFAVLLN